MKLVMLHICVCKKNTPFCAMNTNHHYHQFMTKKLRIC